MELELVESLQVELGLPQLFFTKLGCDGFYMNGFYMNNNKHNILENGLSLSQVMHCIFLHSTRITNITLLF